MNTSNHDYKGKIKTLRNKKKDTQGVSKKPKRDPPITQLCSRHPQHTKKKIRELSSQASFPKIKTPKKKKQDSVFSLFFFCNQRKENLSPPS